ncbi:unnamed protein product [Staurois parvus]|uniref:Secreted protein n=1 Tax=Staurois parvus TaxID=386267 RepID=A0ABN9AES4_9NEOB|nr:unnamed protein product [Staurois parvus]
MPLIRSDLLLLTWRVTRRFSACCLVPYRPLCYRLGLVFRPSILHGSIRCGPGLLCLFTSGSHPATCHWRFPLPQLGVPRGRDCVSVCSKSIPTIRGSGEQADWGSDSAPWGNLVCGALELPSVGT